HRLHHLDERRALRPAQHVINPQPPRRTHRRLPLRGLRLGTERRRRQPRRIDVLNLLRPNLGPRRTPACRRSQRLPLGNAHRRRGGPPAHRGRRVERPRHRLRNHRSNKALHPRTAPSGPRDDQRESARCGLRTLPYRRTIRPRPDQGAHACLTLFPPASSPFSAVSAPTKSATSPKSSSPPDPLPLRFRSTRPTLSTRSPHWSNDSATTWRSVPVLCSPPIRSASAIRPVPASSSPPTQIPKSSEPRSGWDSPPTREPRHRPRRSQPSRPVPPRSTSSP